jgi:hypothetical protein
MGFFLLEKLQRLQTSGGCSDAYRNGIGGAASPTPLANSATGAVPLFPDDDFFLEGMYGYLCRFKILFS